MNRRHLLQGALATAPIIGASQMARASDSAGGDSFSFVHFTDPHIQPERGAMDGMKQCLHMVNELEPDFAINGGDLIMDALHVSEERAKLEWDCAAECLAELKVPAYHVIGNHDIGGWSTRAQMDESSPYFGKAYFREHYGDGRTYRSFDHKGWHFIILDTIGQLPDSPDYRGWIDAEQTEWLKADLAAAGRDTPVVIATHVPFQTTLHQLTSDPTLAPVGPHGTVNNFHTIWKLLQSYNVQLILSGHGHIRERLDVGGLTHIQSGAVCGLWWKGDVHGEDEAFNVITCHADGSFDYRFESIGWKVRA